MEPSGSTPPWPGWQILDHVESAAPARAVEAVTREIGAALNATHVAFLLTDLSGRALVRLTQLSATELTAADTTPGIEGQRRDAAELATAVPLLGGPADRALRTQTVQVLPPGGTEGPDPRRWTVLAPVTERGEALGLLELALPQEPDQRTLQEIARTAHLLGFVVIANRRHTDLYEWAQRSVPFSLSAEIQRRLLPAAYTCEGGSFTLSAWLEPAQSVGGDTFDYCLGPDSLHLSMTDAMGHGVGSSLLATLCVGSLRNSRRYGASLLDQAAAANDALVEHAGRVSGEGFTTGLLGRLDLHTGVLALVNAGHAQPYLARGQSVRVLTLRPDLPFGFFPDTRYRSTDVALQPGDRLVFVTDGMLERNAATLDLPALIAKTRGLHPRETTRALADLVLAATGHALSDDATILVVDWHGEQDGGRRTTAGADREIAGGSALRPAWPDL